LEVVVNGVVLDVDEVDDVRRKSGGWWSGSSSEERPCDGASDSSRRNILPRARGGVGADWGSVGEAACSMV
jgi:hypothetical protein